MSRYTGIEAYYCKEKKRENKISDNIQGGLVL